jgi:hypothetical protein
MGVQHLDVFNILDQTYTPRKNQDGTHKDRFRQRFGGLQLDSHPTFLPTKKRVGIFAHKLWGFNQPTGGKT